eukprot:2397809-Rhodomonas_salina.2
MFRLAGLRPHVEDVGADAAWCGWQGANVQSVDASHNDWTPMHFAATGADPVLVGCSDASQVSFPARSTTLCWFSFVFSVSLAGGLLGWCFSRCAS